MHPICCNTTSCLEKFTYEKERARKRQITALVLLWRWFDPMGTLKGSQGTLGVPGSHFENRWEWVAGQLESSFFDSEAYILFITSHLPLTEGKQMTDDVWWDNESEDHRKALLPGKGRSIAFQLLMVQSFLLPPSPTSLPYSRLSSLPSFILVK